MDFQQQLSTYTRRVEDGIVGLVPPATTRPARIHEAMLYTLQAGGKRLRPVLTLAAADGCGGSEPFDRLRAIAADALPAAIAIECIHTYSLIHDDLPCMDDDDLRRGRPTAHKAFDEATAVLAGDALLTLAFQIVGRGYKGNPALTASLVREIADAAGSERLIGGQMEDILAEKKANVTPAELEFIHLNKTAAMITLSLVAGGLCAGANEATIGLLRSAGRNLGLAFQIIDDVEREPLGGTKSSVIRFARVLARRGHWVRAYTNCVRPLVHEGVHWIPLSEEPPRSCDLYIACQHPRLFGFVPRPKRLVGWMLWQPNEWKHYKNCLKVWWYRPIPILMSQYQARIYSPVLPRPKPQIVIPLGLPDDIRGLAPLASPPPARAVFFSNPQRNLNALVRIWCELILPRCPGATLNIYGINGLQPGDQAWSTWRDTLLPGHVSPTCQESVRIHSPLPRAELNAAVRGSRVLLYLGHKVEAFCLAVAEAQAMGVPCVVASKTVLPERVVDGKTGFVRDDPQEFADAAVKLLTDDVLWRRQHQAALKYQQGLSWEDFATRFENAVLSN